MMGKRERSEDVYGLVLQRLRDMVRAGLPKPQCPVVEESHSSGARLDPTPSRAMSSRFSHGMPCVVDDAQ
jgi:hypothetical protein